MVKFGIKIFARIRPTKKAVGLYELGEAEDSVAITVPRSEVSGFVNNKKEVYTFRFNRVFNQDSKQDEVFEVVSRGVIDNCLEGYNGTIFAYGQTGSGKTFTITGGAERYADRGIIPRTLSYLFQQYQKCAGTIYTTHISYLEIYNESGYDLLDPKHEASKLEDLPKVTLLEDGEGSIHLRNLSLHPASNEEEALNWLFIGDTNRMIAETPMNMASTRSHCIFTIHIASREPGSDTIRRAKLHLVDLAGSERVGKTGTEGTLLTEAKCINLSLHFLEQVIVALSEKSRTHIPYRNSMMTSVLRDSLGGNCMTTMIATCSVEKRNIDETISTCRFAQRVALVKNEAVLNEELDPKLMVVHLRQHVQELKEELAMATGEQHDDELTQDESDKCGELVHAYLQDSSPEARLLVGGDMRKIQLCFQILKTEALKARRKRSSSPEIPPRDHHSSDEDGEPEEGRVQQQQPTSDAELKRLRDLLKQRDDEISILLKMLKQERRRAAEAEATLQGAGVEPKRAPSPIMGSTSPLPLPPKSSGFSPAGPPSSREMGSFADSEQSVSGSSGLPFQHGLQKGVTSSGNEREGQGVHSQLSQDFVKMRAALKTELSQARQEAFDSFRRNYADTSTIDQHKRVLKAKYAEAKALGERVNTSRKSINKLKTQVEQLRVSREVQGLTEGGAPGAPDSREEGLKREMEREKGNFKQLYGQLCDLKTEIEHIQHLLEKSRMQLQKDFEQWWDQQTADGKTSISHSTRSAWRTPPSSSTIASHLSATTADTTTRLPSSKKGRLRHSQAVAAHFPQQVSPEATPSSPSQRSSYESSSTSTHDSIQPRTAMTASDSGQASFSNYTQTSSNLHLQESTSSGLSTFSGGTLSTARSTQNTSSQVLSPSGMSTKAATGSRHFGPKQQPQSLPKVGRAGVEDTFRQPQTLFRTAGQLYSNRSSEVSSLSDPLPQHSIPLTGDSRADADIIAFYKARQKLIKKGHSRK